MFFWEYFDVGEGKGWRGQYKEATLVAYPGVGLDEGLWYWATWADVTDPGTEIDSGTAKDEHSAIAKAEQSVMRGCG